MALLPLKYRPCVVKDLPEYAAEGFAIDSDKIRWVDGKAQSQGGYERIGTLALSGKARGYFSWFDNSGNFYEAIGTNKKLYVLYGGFLYNITPRRSSGTFGANPFQTTASSAEVIVTLTNHGALVGDTVFIGDATAVGGITIGGPSGTFGASPFSTTTGSRSVQVTHVGHTMTGGDVVNISGASAVGGITLSGNYNIQIIDADSYFVYADTAATSSAIGGGTPNYYYSRAYIVTQIDGANQFRFNHISAASGSATGGGSNAKYLFEINIGNESAGGGTGYGEDGYGEGGYGGLTASGASQPRTWSMDNWGEFLVANPLDGGIYEWTINLSRPAVIITNAPVRCRCIAVTPERVLAAFGCTSLSGVFNPLLVRWTDTQDNTAWTPSASNIANDALAGTGSQFVRARTTRDGTAVWTDTAMFFMRYTAASGVYYQLDQLGLNSGLIGPNAVAELNGALYWVAPGFRVMSWGGIVS